MQKKNWKRYNLNNARERYNLPEGDEFTIQVQPYAVAMDLLERCLALDLLEPRLANSSSTSLPKSLPNSIVLILLRAMRLSSSRWPTSTKRWRTWALCQRMTSGTTCNTWRRPRSNPQSQRGSSLDGGTASPPLLGSAVSLQEGAGICWSRVLCETDT